MRLLVDSGTFPSFFGDDVTLVPVPGHAPLAPGAVSTTQRITAALHAQRLSAEVVPLLRRASLVGKSAFSEPQNRPRANDHYRSLALNPLLTRPRRVLLVDDFVTRGATLIGAASKISEGFPGVEVRGFALVRSNTDGEIPVIRAPCIGQIEMGGDGSTSRRP